MDVLLPVTTEVISGNIEIRHMKALQERIEDIREEVIAIHNLAQKSVQFCLYGLEGNEYAKKKVIQIEQIVDRMNTAVDCKCISSVALFQPLAKDLRFILSMVRISGNYERITDLCGEIAMYTLDDSIAEVFGCFVKMKDKILEMFDLLYVTLKTGSTKNLKDKLIKLDDIIDYYYVKSIESLAKQVYQKDFEKLVDTILVAEHLERIGDILTKTGSRYVFIEEGRRVWIK